jgi:hypothetical protein
VSVERLDKLMDWVEKNPAGTLEVIVSLAKLAAVFAYIWTRNKLVDQEWEIRKQEYARKQASGNRAEIGAEDMDGK